MKTGSNGLRSGNSLLTASTFPERRVEEERRGKKKIEVEELQSKKHSA
jgi:hypothetical protein